MGRSANKTLNSRFSLLIRHGLFWKLTLFGNGMILLGSALLFYFEKDNEQVSNFLDALLWSVGVVTTTGYGNFIAITLGGKICVLVLMLFGSIFLWSYMGFLVTGLISPELAMIEKDVKDVEKEVKEMVRNREQS